MPRGGRAMSDGSQQFMPSHAARETWQAYLHMEDGKRRYFDLLKAVDRAEDGGVPPSLVDRARLRELLDEHGRRVREFGRRATQLARTDARAHAWLMDHLREWIEQAAEDGEGRESCTD